MENQHQARSISKGGGGAGRWRWEKDGGAVWSRNVFVSLSSAAAAGTNELQQQCFAFCNCRDPKHLPLLSL